MKRALSWLMVSLFAVGSMGTTAAFAHDNDDNGRHLGWQKQQIKMNAKQYQQWLKDRRNDNRGDDRRYGDNRYSNNNNWWNNDRYDNRYDQRIGNLRARLERQENLVNQWQNRVDELRRRDRTNSPAYREALRRLRTEQAQYQAIRSDLQRYISSR